MALNRKTSPTGVDKLIDKWQKLLYDGLTSKGWLDYESYPRGYPNVDSKDGNKVKAEHFTTSTDYKGVLMDDGYAATSFFLVSGTDGSGVGLTQSTISVIFQTDLKKLYTTSLGRFDEELINDIKAINKKLDGRFQEGAISRTIDEVYTEFDTDLIKKGAHNHEPYNVVRFDMTVTYQHSCADEYARGDCTVKVSVSTTAETSIGANNGTATANVTGDQGNLTYLWTTTDGTIPSGEEIKQTATGLSPASYSVLVTDDNAISCTASASGTVQEGQPLPTCNISIDSVTVTPPSLTGGSDGSAFMVVTGNSGSIGSEWDDGTSKYTTNPATGLSSGAISACALDQSVLGCADSALVIIPRAYAFTFQSKVSVSASYSLTYTGSNTITWNDGIGNVLTGDSVTFPWTTTDEKSITVSVDDPENITNLSSVDFDGGKLSGTIYMRNLVNLGGYLGLESNPLVTEFLPPIGGGSFTHIFLQNNDLSGVLDWSGLNMAGKCHIASNTSVTGWTLPTSNTNTFDYLVGNGCDLGYVDVSGLTNVWKKNNHFQWWHNNNMTSTEVNQMLQDAWDLVSGETSGGDYTGRTFKIDGTNAAPDSSSGGIDGTQRVIDLATMAVIVTHS